MKEKYQLGDLRVIGSTLITSAVIFGVGAFVISKMEDVTWTNLSNYPTLNNTPAPNSSKIFHFGGDALITSSQFFEIVGLAVVAGIVIALIVRSL